MNAPPAPIPPSVGPSRPQTDDLRLRGLSLLLARTAWVVLAALSISLFVAGIPAEFALLHIPCPTASCPTGQLSPASLRTLEGLGLSLDSFAAYTVVMDVLFATVCCAVGALIFWRRSDDRMALFVSLALVTFGTATFTSTTAALAARHPVSGIPVSLLGSLGSACFGLFLYIFPDGRFVPRWARWVALVWISWQFAEHLFPRWASTPGAWQTWTETVIWICALGTVTYSQIYRYRRISNPVHRQQIKWVVFGIAVALAGFLGVQLIIGVIALEPASPGALLAYLIGYTLISYLAVLLIPASLGIAVLRYHLFDVDLVINRALVYGTLTISLGLLYFGSIAALRAVLFGITQSSQLFIVASTLAIAALFNPLRRRIQAFMDRLFYRPKYDAAKTLETFAARLRNETDLGRLTDDLTAVVRETIQPEHVSLLLHQPDGDHVYRAHESEAGPNGRRTRKAHA